MPVARYPLPVSARLALSWTLLGVAAAASPSAVGAQATRTRPAAAAPVITKFVVAGIPVILKPITANDVIAVRLYVRGGSAAQSASTAGIERFIGAVASRGTEKYDGDEFASLATTTGTNIAFEAGYDFSAFQAQGVRQHWNQTWELFTQAVLHPLFPPEEVEQIRGRLLNALKQRVDDPDSHLEMAADSILYAGHAYAVNPEGSPEAIARITRDELAAWHKRRLTRANLVLVVVGNVSRADLTKKVQTAFGSLPATGGLAPRLAPLGELKPDVLLVKQDLPTNYIMGVYVAPDPRSPDFPALRVATRVLSERLFEEVRTKRNLSYAVYSGMSARSANRANIYVTAVDPDTTLKVMLNEIRRLQQEPVPVDRLKQSINVFATGLLMQQQTNMGQASALGLWEISGGGWENAGRYIDRLRAVTPQDVQRAATKYLKNARFVVIGDPAKIDRALLMPL